MNQIHYSMIIQWDSRDNIFVVRVPELPGCVTHGTTYEEAVKQGKDAIESLIIALCRVICRFCERLSHCGRPRRTSLWMHATSDRRPCRAAAKYARCL